MVAVGGEISGVQAAAGAGGEAGFQSVSSELRPVERFFATVWAPRVTALAKPIVGVFSLATVIIFACYSIRMQMAHTQVEIWPQLSARAPFLH